MGTYLRVHVPTHYAYYYYYSYVNLVQRVCVCLSAVIVSTEWIIFQIDDLTANVVLVLACTPKYVYVPH